MKPLVILACLLATAVTGFRPSTIHKKPFSLRLASPQHASAPTPNSDKKPTSAITATAAPRNRFQKIKQRAAAFAIATMAWRSPAFAAATKVAPQKETHVAAKLVAVGAAGAGIAVGYRALPSSSGNKKRFTKEEKDQTSEDVVQVQEMKPDDPAKLIAQKAVKEILTRINKTQSRVQSSVDSQGDSQGECYFGCRWGLVGITPSDTVSLL